MSQKPDTFLLTLGDERFPNRLSALQGFKSVEKLFCLGNLELLNSKGVGFCGSRKASEKGLATAKDCAEQAAANGVVVISGNAAGVDRVAHFEALAAGGTTILVLPEGMEHFRIRKELREVWDWDKTLVISQFEPSVPWRSYHAMTRNKVILGLSHAMIVIEAGDRGGTLDAGKSTIKADRPLFVAQYEGAPPEAAGNEILIRLGGIPLNRLRSTNRANMQKVWDSFDDDAHIRQKKLI